MFQAGNSFEVLEEDTDDFNDFDHLERYRQTPPSAQTSEEICLDIDKDNDRQYVSP